MRKSSEETNADYQATKKLIASGMPIVKACAETGCGTTAYYNRSKQEKKGATFDAVKLYAPKTTVGDVTIKLGDLIITTPVSNLAEVVRVLR